jgi:hypothetical protein
MIFKYIFLFLLVSCASYKSNNPFKTKKDIHYGKELRNTGDLYLSSLKNAPLVSQFTAADGLLAATPT